MNATAKYYLQTKYTPVIKSFIEGFDSVLPGEDLLIFFSNEFYFLTCGIKNIDGSLILNLAKYTGGNSILINFFKRYLLESSKEMLTNFLKFVTGNTRKFYLFNKYNIVYFFYWKAQASYLMTTLSFLFQSNSNLLWIKIICPYHTLVITH